MGELEGEVGMRGALADTGVWGSMGELCEPDEADETDAERRRPMGIG